MSNLATMIMEGSGIGGLKATSHTPMTMRMVQA